MANRPLSFETAKQAVEAVDAALRGGFKYRGQPSAIGEAVRVLGIEEKTLHGSHSISTAASS